MFLTWAEVEELASYCRETIPLGGLRPSLWITVSRARARKWEAFSSTAPVTLVLKVE